MATKPAFVATCVSGVLAELKKIQITFSNLIFIAELQV